MSTYTKESQNIFMLNDKNIAMQLSDDISLNAIPSLDLLITKCSEFNAKDLALDAKAELISSLLDSKINSTQHYAESVSSTADSKYVWLSGGNTTANGHAVQGGNEFLGTNTFDVVQLSTLNVANGITTASDAVTILSGTTVIPDVLSVQSSGKHPYGNVIHLSSSTVVDVNFERMMDNGGVSSLADKFRDLSAQARSDFFLKSGGTVDGRLSVIDSAAFNGTVIAAKGAAIAGGSFGISGLNNSIAIGKDAFVNSLHAFVWNGDGNSSYQDRGSGTFCINPDNSDVRKVFIGDTSLSDIIKNDVTRGTAEATAHTDAASVMLSADYVYRVAAAEARANAHTDSSYYDLSIATSEELQQVRNDMMSFSIANTNVVSASLSNTVKNAGYAIYDDFTFSYDDTTRLISMRLKDLLGNESELKTIDASKFIKGAVVNRMMIVDVEIPGSVTTEKRLRIYWDSSDTNYVEIPLRELIYAYKSGTGINIDSSTLSISVTDYVAKSSDLTALSYEVSHMRTHQVNKLSSNVETVSADVRDVKSYINSLSCSNGTLDSMMSAINDIADVTADVSERCEEVATDVDSVKTHVNSILSYVNDLSCKGGTISELSNSISAVSKEIRNAMALVGHIRVDFDRMLSGDVLPWQAAGKDNNLSSILQFYGFAERAKVKNGSTYEVQFYSSSMSQYEVLPEYLAKMAYTTADGVQLKAKDYIVIHSCESVPYIDLSSISKDKAYRLQSVTQSDVAALSALIREDYVWLSGGNNAANSHAISGDNLFLGDNVFNGTNTFTNVSAVALSASSIDANVMVISSGVTTFDDQFVNFTASVVNMTFGNDLMSSLEPLTIKNKEDNTILAIKNPNVAEGAIIELGNSHLDVDFDKLHNGTSMETLGSDLDSLSVAIDSKVTICDRTSSTPTSLQSDLSIVKLNKFEFDNMFSDPVTLSDNVMYIVSADYMDAYGLTLSNLTMTDDSNPSEAASLHYVDAQTTEIKRYLYSSLSAGFVTPDGRLRTVSELKQEDVANCVLNLISKLSADLA